MTLIIPSGKISKWTVSEMDNHSPAESATVPGARPLATPAFLADRLPMSLKGGQSLREWQLIGENSRLSPSRIQREDDQVRFLVVCEVSLLSIQPADLGLIGSVFTK